MERNKQTKMSRWKCSYGKSCECKNDLEKSECDLAYIAKKMTKSTRKRNTTKWKEINPILFTIVKLVKLKALLNGVNQKLTTKN